MKFDNSTIDPSHRGSNQSGLRAYNERLVLTLVRRHKALTKTTIARMTGLSLQTVSVIMRQLEADGLLQRGEPNRVRGKVGQPSIPMSLVPRGALFFGLKLGRRSSDLVLIDVIGTVIANVRRTYRYPIADDIVDFVRHGLEQIVADLPEDQRGRIAGLGIGMPFQLWNWAEAVGAPRQVMDSWRTTDMKARIAAVCPFPVYLQNDASAACGAELVFGKAGLRNFLYFYIGYFIGGGVVLNGSLYTGPSGNAGALGPMPVPTPGGDSRQLIEVASIATLARAIDAAGGISSELWDSPDQWNVDIELLNQWIENAGRGIAHAIVASASLIDFEAAVIDGWFPSKVRTAIVAAIKRYLPELDFTGIEAPEVREGTVGHHARAIGAASLPLSLRFLVDQSTSLKSSQVA